MATAYKIHITPDNTGLWGIRQNDQAAEAATVLLQKDMNNHHVFFNQEGFHDHISHQILALYGTGASASDLRKAFAENESYQRAAKAPRENLVEELRDWDKAKQRLGKEQYYSDWLLFFEHEIERLGGWQKTLSEYMFKGDERSQDMLVRMYAGFLHPLIQLMYGVEWDQPAMVAMALAQASVHRDELAPFLLGAEAKARASARLPMPRIAELLEAAAGNEKLRNSPHLDDGNKIRDGVLARAWDEAVECTGRVKVSPDEARGADGGDVQYGHLRGVGRGVAHHVTSAPIFVTLNKQDWIPTEYKVRMLEWKIRMDIVQYVARGSPKLSVEKIANYVPKDEVLSSSADRKFSVLPSFPYRSSQVDENTRTNITNADRLTGLFPTPEMLPRMHSLSDDGHVIKLWRAVGVGRKLSEPYEDRSWLQIKGSKLWDQVAHLIMDSVEAPGPRWVRNAGFEEAWKVSVTSPKPSYLSHSRGKCSLPP
ncbi:hypothetical protein PG997_013853 [Apiospora hydei]|uniref:HypA protein n=1 Tax=Apiospora hydei TaxID=1337664 RepID=A0ABR1V7E2_9PEZI